METALYKHRMEKKMQESERKYRQILETVRDVYFEALRDGTVLEVSASVERVFGYRREDVVGSSLFDIAADPILREGFARAGNHGETIENLEIIAGKKDGTRIHCSAHFRAVHSGNGMPGNICGVLRETTEQKAAEEECMLLMTAIEQAAETIVITDHEGTIKYVNPSFERVTGYARTEALGSNFGIIRSGEHDEQFYKGMWATLVRGDVWRGRLINRRRDGRLFEEEATISPIKDEFGRISNYVAVKRDVTHQMLLEKQLHQAQKMESIGTLAGGIAHDFNNLLQIVLGYADMVLMDKGRQSPDAGNLEIIRKAAMDGRELVKGLLTFSRQVESELRPVNLNMQLKRFHTVLRRTIPRMIEIELSTADDLHTVNADPIQMEQVLLNIAVNAHHAMPRGGKLSIETENVTLDEDYCRNQLGVNPGEYVQLRIADTGHGMKKEVVEHIFEPFFTTKSAGEGTGLGLSIVYGIVKNHGGHITCTSLPGRGTVFTIRLPVLGRQAVPDAAVKVKQTPQRGTETILLVDDEDTVRNMLERSLTRNGYRVISAANGSRALEIYRQKMEEIDLVVLDLIMPEMGGEQCLEEILTLNPTANVFVASGYSGTITSNKIVEAGAVAFIAKPFDVRDFLREVRRILDEAGSEGSPANADRPGHGRRAAHEGVRPPGSALSPLASMPRQEAHIEEPTLRLRILAIDDREPYLIMFSAGLAQFGQTTLTAVSGSEGIRIFEETPVDLVVCDLEMPDLDGWEVAARIKEVCRERDVAKTPVILLTGRADMEDVHQGYAERMTDCGVDAILGKPTDIPEILTIAEKLLREADRKT
ncbi:MAG: PAS domain S-box protein [Pseudomonadota bacterium]